MLENTKGAIKNKISIEASNKDEEKTKQKHSTLCVGHHYRKTTTNNVNKTCALLQTTGDKDEPNIGFMRES